MKNTEKKADPPGLHTAEVAESTKQGIRKVVPRLSSLSCLTRRQTADARRENARLRDEIAALKKDVNLLKRAIKAKQEPADTPRIRKQRPELEAIGVMADYPFWHLEEEAIQEMRRAENELYSEDDVEIPA
jgi:cell division protein FtsB